MGRKLVVFCDGTGNEPADRTNTNVVRMLDMLATTNQIPHYVAGVGTLSELEHSGWWKRTKMKARGLAFGDGLRSNVADAYEFLMDNYRKDDEIYLFGFSRGAFTVRALAGLLQVCGLLQPGNKSLISHAINLYWKQGEWDKAHWDKCDQFREIFGNPEFPEPRKPWDDETVVKTPQVHFMGMWDTVKFVAGLQFPRLSFKRGVQWFKIVKVPYTRDLISVDQIRHAVSIDERRYFYKEYLLEPQEVESRPGLREIWFAGVHSDVGGTFDVGDHYLADLTLRWIADEAEKADLVLDATAKAKHATITPDHPFGLRHKMSKTWWIAGGWRARPMVPDNAMVHTSVHQRMQDEKRAPDHGERLPGDKKRYESRLPGRVQYVNA